MGEEQTTLALEERVPALISVFLLRTRVCVQLFLVCLAVFMSPDILLQALESKTPSRRALASTNKTNCREDRERGSVQAIQDSSPEFEATLQESAVIRSPTGTGSLSCDAEHGNKFRS